MGLARPGRWVGGVHAAPHAAAKLQAPHVPHHGGGIEGLLAVGRKQDEKQRRDEAQRLSVPTRINNVISSWENKNTVEKKCQCNFCFQILILSCQL